MLTCAAGACTSLTNFSTANTAITATQLGAVDDAERTTLIDWARQGPAGRGWRRQPQRNAPSVHGDVAHSRPVAINYGSTGNPAIVTFYGGNDGALRAVVGNRTIMAIHGGGRSCGRSCPEFYSKIKRLYSNSVPISFPGFSGATTPAQDYGMDGPVVAHHRRHSRRIYATMRRGGRALYAFNVTDPTAPALKWKRGCPSNFTTSGTVSDSNCSEGFAGIGQTRRHRSYSRRAATEQVPRPC